MTRVTVDGRTLVRVPRAAGAGHTPGYVRKPIGLLVGLLCLVLWPAVVSALDTAWKRYTEAGLSEYQQGRYAEAEPMLLAALREAERFGSLDLRLAVSCNNLAELYRAQDNYTEAERLYKRSLAIFEKTLDPDHPSIAMSLNNLALLYQAHGKYAEAEPLYRRSLAIFEKTLGPEHSEVIQSLHNLALAYRLLDKYAEAEALLRRAIAIGEKALGAEHPTVATSLENYAALLRKTNREAEAASMESRAQAIRSKRAQKKPTM